MKCPELHIKLKSGNATLMQQEEGFQGPIHEKCHNGNPKQCPELMFSITVPHQGVCMQFTKTFCWKYHEIPSTPQKFNVWQLPPH